MNSADHSLVVRDRGGLPVLAAGYPAIIADWIGKR
jgi:hypothetical protein